MASKKNSDKKKSDGLLGMMKDLYDGRFLSIDFFKRHVSYIIAIVLMILMYISNKYAGMTYHNEVLKLMRRHYDRELFAEKVRRCQELMPDCFIGVDVMVGSRGETPECFEECYEFLKSLDVTQLHVFPYSERPGTAALKIPYIVDEQEKKRRSNVLLELSEQKTLTFYTQHLGEERLVLLEKGKGNSFSGFTDNYIKIQLKPVDNKCNKSNPATCVDNTIVKVKLMGINAKKDAVVVHTC